MAAYDFTTLSTFTDIDGKVYGAILKGMQSADLWTTYPDTIHPRTIPVISDTMYLLQNGTLPLSMDTGSTQFSGMTLTPIDLGVVRGYGAADFNQYYGKFQNSTMLEQGLPFENFLYDYIVNAFMNKYEDKMFNHPTSGLNYILRQASGLTTNVTYSAITAGASAIDQINHYWLSKPSSLIGEDCDLWISAEDFENYVIGLQKADLYDEAARASNVRGNRYVHPGTGGKLTIIGLNALNDKNISFLTNKFNFGWGYGSEQDFNNTHQFVYDVNSDKRIFRLKTKMAVGCHVPAQVLRAV